MKHTQLDILIAEDDHLVSEMIRGMLEDNNYNVVGEAVNGLNAVHLTEQLDPDIVLMDINMPEMDGIEATRRIIERKPLPIIALTAFDETDLVVKASAAGVCSYLIKPPDAEEINRSIIVAQKRFLDMKKHAMENKRLKELINKKHLSGLIPICAQCKDIRVHDNSWISVEKYIANRSNAEFSHGLCPDCIKELYPQYYTPKENS